MLIKACGKILEGCGMYLKKRHIEILREMKNTESQAEIEAKLPEDFQIRAIELYILGFAELEGGQDKADRCRQEAS